MTRNNTLGYWVAQEQYSMANLFEFVKEAERCGFTTAMTSDHFHPWWHDNGYGNFTWVWMGSIALLVDAYTQYFLFLWDPLPAALFFFLLALSFLILGRKAEVIWGK